MSTDLTSVGIRRCSALITVLLKAMHLCLAKKYMRYGIGSQIIWLHFIKLSDRLANSIMGRYYAEELQRILMREYCNGGDACNK